MDGGLGVDGGLRVGWGAKSWTESWELDGGLGVRWRARSWMEG